MTIPETLSEMRFLMHRKTTLQDQLERARSAATTSGGIGDGMPHGNAQEPKLERYGLYIAELSAQIDTIDRKLAIYADDLRPVINRVGDARDAEALRLRYINNLSASKVAEKMQYNRTAMLRIIRNAEAIWMK